MIHSKSKSTKIKENEKEIKKNNSINYMDSTKENINLNLIINQNDNFTKMSNLLCEQDNDDKIVNISKLDDVLFSEDRKDKNNELCQKHMDGDSKFELILEEQNQNDNTNPIINISNLDMSIFKNEENEQKINKSIEDINHSNDNINKKENNINKITIIERKDEVLKIQKKKNCIEKLPFYCKIILIVNIFIILTFLLFFLFKIIINKFYN